jgi:hypothetical protein
METKVCSKCKMEKELKDFHKDNSKKDGFRKICKSCKIIYRKNNKEKLNESNKIYRENNKDKIKAYKENNKDIFKEYSINYRIKNKDILKTYHKEYQENNKDKISQSKKQWISIDANRKKTNKNGNIWKKNNKDKINTYKQKNKDKIKIYHKQYQENNKEKIKEYYKERILNEPLYKLKTIYRRIVTLSIKRKGYTKKTRTYQILGCSYQEFKNHLESKFQPWMSWDNYGKYNGELNYGWDIDHIIPLSSANSEEEMLKLNHYTNLQPLCSYTNRYIKKDKI